MQDRTTASTALRCRQHPLTNLARGQSVQLAHVPEVAVKHLDEQVDQLHDRQWVLKKNLLRMILYLRHSKTFVNLPSDDRPVDLRLDLELLRVLASFEGRGTESSCLPASL